MWKLIALDGDRFLGLAWGIFLVTSSADLILVLIWTVPLVEVVRRP
jgi:hypothetical protein